MIGKQILNYEIKSLIGEGGMGHVYLAEHTSIERKVAIKVLRPELAKNAEIHERFKNEASVMARLQHPGIVALHDYVEEKESLYLIMEYVEGKELSQLIKELNEPMGIVRAKKIMKQVLEAFSYAHKNGVVHRDVKPENILIDKDDNIKILDFGIAKLVGDAQFNLTKTGVHVGTVYYMSPEQVKAQELDHRSDIYSLGVTFYELLTGVCPYRSLSSEYEISDAIVRQPLLPLSEVMGEDYKQIWSVIYKATQKDQNDRFQSCNDFMEALHESKTVEVRPVQVQQETDVIVTENNSESKYQKKWALPIIIGAIVVLFGLFLIPQLLGSVEEESDEPIASSIVTSEPEVEEIVYELPEQYDIDVTYSYYSEEEADFGMGQGTQVKFYPIGWSLDGEKVAFRKTYSLSGLGCEFDEIIIRDIIQDKDGVSLALKGDCEDKHVSKARINEFLKEQEIYPSFDMEESNKIKIEKTEYKFYIDGNWNTMDREERCFYRLMRKDVKGGQKINSKVISSKEEEYNQFHNIKVVGLIKSPFENRVAVLVAFFEYGFEAEGDVRFELFGSNLEVK